MYPILFKLGPLTLHAFGVMMAFGFLVALGVMRRLAQRDLVELDETQLSQLLVWLMVGGVVGARLAYVIEHWQGEFAANPAAIIRIDQGGLMFYGGVIGAIVAIRLFARWQGRHTLALLDLCAAALPLGHAFGRLGCFLNGCCYGRLSSASCAVSFPAGSLAWRDQLAAGLINASAAASLPLLPTQLIELVANLILFAFLYRLALRLPRRGTITAAYLMLYAVIRFNTEFLRGDLRWSSGGLSIGQWISSVIFAVGLLLLLLTLRRRRQQPTGQA